MSDNHHHAKLNIRKRVQRVLYSTITASEDGGYGDDGVSNSGDAAPMPHVFDIEPTSELHDSSFASSKVLMLKGSTTNASSTTPAAAIPQQSVSKEHSNSSAYGLGSYAIIRPMQYSYNVMCMLTEWIAISSKRCWFILIVAIFIEIYATTLMKISVDSKSLTKTFASTCLYMVSLLLFGVSLRQIDVSIAYATWTAVGTASVAVFGILLFGEAYTKGKIISLLLIMVGVMGLNISDAKH